MNLTCIVCPIGCSLKIEKTDEGENLNVSGSKCPRGIDYAKEEILSPKRIVTATCKTEGEGIGRIPVKTTLPCPKEKIPALLNDIYKLKVKLPVIAGDVLINGWQGEKIDVIVTRTYP